MSKLADWEAAPGAGLCHPREEHLLHLFVLAGATDTEQEHKQLIFEMRAEPSNHAVTGYLFS